MPAAAALEESIKLQTAIVELVPKSWEMRASLANLYYYGNDDASAETHAREAVRLNPKSSGMPKEPCEADANSHNTKKRSDTDTHVPQPRKSCSGASWFKSGGRGKDFRTCRQQFT